MVLVLGRPGSGCSTLLRVLANDRVHYKEIKGDIKYSHLTPKMIKKHYKGEVLYNQEGKIDLSLIFHINDKC
jgi:ABC-type multidrug transport system ATPase subunit